MSWSDLVDELRQTANRWRAEIGGEPGAKTLATFIRPNLGPTPAPVRRVLEPVVAASAMLALAVLSGIATINLALFMLCAGLVYLIVTYVFGVELDLNVPR